ncbi:hypothetical protein SYNGFB01_02325 [Synechococcus sp. GFB01]|nr:hypothetical protein SYNGFB01_02325 [Synechococcus sp. GFB01]
MSSGFARWPEQLGFESTGSLRRHQPLGHAAAQRGCGELQLHPPQLLEHGFALVGIGLQLPLEAAADGGRLAGEWIRVVVDGA